MHLEPFPVCVHRPSSTASPSAAIVSKIQQVALVLPTRATGKEIYMDTKKFTAEYRRLCSTYARCADCPLNGDGKCITPPHDYIHRFVSILNVVKDWSAAHPIVTRADIFKKIYPNVRTYTDGTLRLCPHDIDESFECPAELNCFQCRKKYWFQEVKNGR